jgi:hypothetical protein
MPIPARSLWASAALLALLAAGASAQKAVRPRAPVLQRPIYTHGGIAVIGYAPATSVRLIDHLGKTAWSGNIGNRQPTVIKLQDGNYTLRALDEIKLISENLQPEEMAGPRTAASDKPTPSLRPLSPGPLKVVPVPWVADATFASNPPSLQSRHVIFEGIQTRLKAVIEGGTGPYRVDWDPGDGSGVLTTTGVTDGYNGAAKTKTYSLPQGTPITATCTVTDSLGATAVGYYHMIVGNPSIQAHRVARSKDEALWYLHTQMGRADNVVRTGHPGANEGWIYSGGHWVACTAMYAVCLENTGRAILGGKNLSNDPSKDAYVDDLIRCINALTDANYLISGSVSTKTYATYGSFNPDTHGPSGVPNGKGLRSYSGYPVYEGGMHLQAIAQAGNTEGPVPNRSDYASYYDLIGDFVDGFQYMQGNASWYEGGWRYGYSYSDSDGSAVAWAAIALEAAQLAHLNTPHPGPSWPQIAVHPTVLAALNDWYTRAFDTDSTTPYNRTDYRLGSARNFHRYGGQDYIPGYNYDNVAKTGGALVGLKMVGASAADTRVVGAQSFLYRFFFAPDWIMAYHWGSPGYANARDSYAMYNMFKGLTAWGVGTLTDPLGSGGNDLDGVPLNPFDWYSVLLDFIAGRAPSGGATPTDLGHQVWPGNTTITSYAWSSTQDGHYESTGTRSSAIPPLALGEWSRAHSDANAGENLTTAWDLAILQSTVFTPPPVAVISRPSASAGETYVPDQVGGADWYATFDPGGNGMPPDPRFGSYHLDPSRYVKRVRWNWGDGTADTEYDLPFPGALGGYVPSAPGIYPAGNQAVHHFTLGPGGTPIDRVVTLTVWDDIGQQSSTTVLIHVIPAPYPPVAVMSFQAMGGSNQDGDTIGVLPDGTVQIKFVGTNSYNPDPSSVLAPKNANGISQFWWEWPANAVPYNTGLSETPPLFDEGTASGDPNLNPGSKDGLQVYTFQFDPAAIASHSLTGIIVGLKVKSNIVGAGVPDTATIYKTVNLKPNSEVTPSMVQIVNVSVHDITEVSAKISFDTVNAGGIPQATKAKIDYGLTNAYGLSTPLTPAFLTHHTIQLTGLASSKTYHYMITATSMGGVVGTTSDATFTTLAPATPILRYRVLSRSLVGTQHLVTYRVTNEGAGIALNVAFSGWWANRGVTFDTLMSPTPTTIPPGGYADFTVRWNLPTPPPANFSTKFTCTFQNSAAPPATYSNTPMLLVFVP